MENIVIEKRKYEYLLILADKKEQEIDNRFKEIDKKMARIKIGSTVYEKDWIDYVSPSYFPKKVTKIIDKENGMIETYESSINRYKIESILGLDLEMGK